MGKNGSTTTVDKYTRKVKTVKQTETEEGTSCVRNRTKYVVE